MAKANEVPKKKQTIKNAIMVAILSFILASIMTVGVSYMNKYFGWDDDNKIEEFLEEAYTQITGKSVDFTPSTLEE